MRTRYFRLLYGTSLASLLVIALGWAASLLMALIAKLA